MFCRFRNLLRLLVLVIPASLFAHDPGLSSARVLRHDDRLDVRLTFAWSDLAPLVAGASSDRPATAALAALGPELAKVSDGLVRVSSNGSLLLSPPPVVFAGERTANEVIVDLLWSRVPVGSLRIDFPYLPKMPFGHRTMLTVGDTSELTALLSARNAIWSLPAPQNLSVEAKAEPTAPKPSGLTSFVLLGVEHILRGFDHLCFLIALLLVAVRLREVFAVVTAFTVAHSLSLAAAATGLISLSPQIVEPLIAASIVYVAIENLFLRQPPRHRVAVVFGFGLVHGLGFASALAERLPGVTGWAVVPPLLGFNVGVELGQLAVAAGCVPLIRWARTRPVLAPRLRPFVSLVIAAAGLVWFWQRV